MKENRQVLFIEKATNIHNGKYDYSNVVYKGSETKVCIICPEHGEFGQTPHIHLSGHGCPSCAYDVNVKKNSNTTEDFITKAIKKHNNFYDYSKVEYVNTKLPVTIVYPKPRSEPTISCCFNQSAKRDGCCVFVLYYL